MKYLFTFLFLFIVTSVGAYDYEPTVTIVDGIAYAIDGDKAVVEPLSFKKWEAQYKGEIIVPEEVIIDNVKYKVKQVDKRAFSECDDLVKVVLPKTVEFIEPGSFYGSKKLIEVEATGCLDKVNGISYTRGGSIYEWNFKNLGRPEDSEGKSKINAVQYIGCVYLNPFFSEQKRSAYYNYDEYNKPRETYLEIRRDSFELKSLAGPFKKVVFHLKDYRPDKPQNHLELLSGGSFSKDSIWEGREFNIKFNSPGRGRIYGISIELWSDSSQLFYAPEELEVSEVTGVTAVTDYALYDNKSLSLSFPEGIEFLGKDAIKNDKRQQLIINGDVPNYDDNFDIGYDHQCCVVKVPKEYINNYINDSLFSRYRIQEMTLTGIERVLENEGIKKAYNLQGQLVDDFYKGIVIVNGKKYLRR